MAETSQHELSEPHTNGVVDGLTEEEKSKMRPADIDADMREMERRKRVEMMMNSRLFREELERIIETQMKDGGAGPSGLLQQISDMMGAQGARFNSNVFKSSNCVVPINDIRGVESMGYAKGEKLLRCKLAAVFRLLDLYGWTQGVGGHITARLNQDLEHFLVNPYGLLYHEVTASSLVKVDMQGSVVEQGTTNFGVHVTGFQLHSTIHAARPDIKCIIHITTPSVIAVSSLKCGLLPLGHESIVIGEASAHQYIGGVFEPEEKEKIARNLGPVNKVMFLTNRGALCCGETVEEAFYNVYNTVLACETQLKLIPAGIDNLSLVTEESRKAIFDASRKPPVPQQSSVVEPSPLADKLEKRWRIGGTEFEALMRMLDNAGFRTGYIYRHPLVKGDPPRPRNDVEVPPAVSSLGYLLEEEELYKQGLWKGGRKGTDRTRWLNSPNVYQKVEILETGTPDPKKITKWVDQNAEEWVTDGSPTHSSTPVKIESALQFVPKNTNPKEFKQLQQQIKDYRRADKISAGPQSHILEGVTWDEAKKMQDATISATGEQVVLVGAASKGIIQRGFQHNAMVYKTPYAKNPFDAVTDQELDQYKKDVERKQKGDPYDESQSESEALSSFNVSRATHESSTAKSPIQSPISITSETEEESRDEPRVLRIETKQVPVPSQPEVVLSDEPTAFAEVLDSPLVQQAQIQQVQHQSLTIINQKPTVDATTEFLNEMRRTSVNPRNDLNRRDCQSSNCSSDSSGHSYGWSTEPYDTIQLEVTRSRTVAPRMTPLITDIAHSYKNPNLGLTNIKNKLPPPAPPKPKPYVALRNAFFNNYSAMALIQSADPQCTDYTYFNSNSSMLTNAQDPIITVDYTIHKTQAPEVSEVFIVCNEQSAPIDLSICVSNKKCTKKSLSAVGISSKSGKKNSMHMDKVTDIDGGMVNRDSTNNHVANDMDTVDCSLSENIENNLNKCVIRCTNILKDAACKQFETNSNNGETVPMKNSNSLHKPLIVGEILKNMKDLHKTCSGSDVKPKQQGICQVIETPESKQDSGKDYGGPENTEIERIEGDTYQEQISKLDLIYQPDENGNSCAITNTSRADEEMNEIHINKTMFISVHTMLNYDIDNTINLLSVHDNEQLEGQNKDSNNQETQKSQCESTNFKKLEDTINNNPEHSTPKQDIQEIDTNQHTDFGNISELIGNNLNHNESVDNCNFTDSIGNKVTNFPSETITDKHSTPPRLHIYHRLDSLTEMIDSVKIDLTPTKMLLDILPEGNMSSKYNLDSTNMSLIYSLTPLHDDEDTKQKVKRNTSVDVLGGSFDNVKFQRVDSSNTNDSVHDEESDYIWVDLLTGTKENGLSEDDSDLNNTIDLFDSPMESLAEVDNISNQGCDILELPHETVQELRDTDAESFNQDIKKAANQIIAELGDIEMYTHASNFIDEIIYDVSCLKFEKKCSTQAVSVVVHDKLQALDIAKDTATTLIADLPCYDTEVFNVSQENDLQSSKSSDYSKTSTSDDIVMRDEPVSDDLSKRVIIIDEIVHHVIDKVESNETSLHSLPDSYNLKRVKESTNSELKEIQNSFKIHTDEGDSNHFCQTNQAVQHLEETSLDDAIIDVRGDKEHPKGFATNSKDNVVETTGSIKVVMAVDQKDNITDTILDAHHNSHVEENFVNDETRSADNNNSAEVSRSFRSNDDRLFITLGSLYSPNVSTILTADVKQCPEGTKITESSNTEETYNDCGHTCSSPLDCDECWFPKSKKYKVPPDNGDSSDCEERLSCFTYTNLNFSSENIESDLTDHDSLGEAILEYCTIAKPCSNPEGMELHFSIERCDVKTQNQPGDSETDLNSNSVNTNYLRSTASHSVSGSSGKPKNHRIAADVLNGLATSEINKTHSRNMDTGDSVLESNFSDNHRDPEIDQFVAVSESKSNESSIDENDDDNVISKQHYEVMTLAECTKCTCCMEIVMPDFMSLGQLPPISEEVSEILEDSNCTETGENKLTISTATSSVKAENQFDYSDCFSDSEILIGHWFDEHVASSGNEKSHETLPEQSAISLESVNTVDYDSCKDDSHSTTFQSLQNTIESSSNILLTNQNNDNSDAQSVHVEAELHELDRTYTLSDTSINSLGTMSSIENDEYKHNGKLLDVTYSADVSTNMNESQQQNSINQVSSSSSSDVLLSHEDHYFDTTMNMADISEEILCYKCERNTYDNEKEIVDGKSDKGEDSSPDLCCAAENKHNLDCMIYSYDTSEFMRLEEALAGNNERELEICHCTCLDHKCDPPCVIPRSELNGLSPLDPPPRYEDTTLYRVVSQINLTDVLEKVPSDLCESPKC